MDPFFITLISLSGLAGIILLVGWIVWLDTRRRAQSLKAETELRTKLLDKFEKATEFAEFVRIEEGKRFLTMPTGLRPSPLARVRDWPS
ncbi:MAG TPA: hypothetical protein VGB17_07425 [Pyrinomonadaceae bacterium]|jgi:hypothetical protein